MPFFDFHIHPVLKSQFSENGVGTEQFSPWEKLRKEDIPFLLKWCTEFSYILESQANLAQLVVNDCNLICAVLYIAEGGMINNSLVKAAAKTKLKRYLQEERIRKILEGNPYRILVEEDLPNLLNPLQFGVADRHVKMITNETSYDPADSNTIHVVFSLEGCHSLCNRLYNYDTATILANLDDLRSRVKLLSLNPTHMECSPVCNQAFAMPYLQGKDGEIFKPVGDGISTDGLTIIQHCYDHEVLVDVKHMSLGSRLQLYRLRTQGQFGATTPPLICTHAGFTGISYTAIPAYVQVVDTVPGKGYFELVYGKPVLYGDSARPSFNPSSINLYDEDIRAILASGGMIGLSLDKRILGYSNFEEHPQTDFPTEHEYVSVREAGWFIPEQGGPVIGAALEDGRCITWDEIEEGGITTPNAAFQHLCHFMAHLLHLISVAGDDAAAALKQVCIGSDFDGIINPVWCCETTDELYHFRQALKDHFPLYAKQCSVTLPAGFSIHEFCEDLFFRNGHRFVMERLSLLD